MSKLLIRVDKQVIVSNTLKANASKWETKFHIFKQAFFALALFLFTWRDSDEKWCQKSC